MRSKLTKPTGEAARAKGEKCHGGGLTITGLSVLLPVSIKLHPSSEPTVSPAGLLEPIPPTFKSPARYRATHTYRVILETSINLYKG